MAPFGFDLFTAGNAWRPIIPKKDAESLVETIKKGVLSNSVGLVTGKPPEEIKKDLSEFARKAIHEFLLSKGSYFDSGLLDKAAETVRRCLLQKDLQEVGYEAFASMVGAALYVSLILGKSSACDVTISAFLTNW